MEQHDRLGDVAANAWIAVDDSPEEWPGWTSAHVVRTDPTHGIAEDRVLSELRVKLDAQFG